MNLPLIIFLTVGGAAGLGALIGLMLYQRSLKNDTVATMDEASDDDEGEEGEYDDEDDHDVDEPPEADSSTGLQAA